MYYLYLNAIFLTVKMVLCSVVVLFPCDRLWSWLYCFRFEKCSVYVLDKTIKFNV